MQKKKAGTDLIGAWQLEFKTEELLDGSHGNPAGAADEPLHQVLVDRSRAVS